MLGDIITWFLLPYVLTIVKILFCTKIKIKPLDDKKGFNLKTAHKAKTTSTIFSPYITLNKSNSFSLR